jgi:hypothetical protein
MAFDELGFGAAFRFVGAEMQRQYPGIWTRTGIQEMMLATHKPDQIKRVREASLLRLEVFMIWSIPEGFQ